MAETILVINAGSSSIMFQLFEVAGTDLRRRMKGQLEGIGSRPHLIATDDQGQVLADADYPLERVDDAGEAQDLLGAWLTEHLGAPPVAIGHRVVHGGPDLARPVRIDAAVIEKLEALAPLAPLHQPSNLGPIRAVRRRLPDLPQIACFDTSFHRGPSDLADRYAIPEALYQEGVRRYGFHGLSYEYIARTLPLVAPGIAGGKVVVAHLGSGASLCALDAGKSVDSTMGFTALDGLPMGTRPGLLDPGVVLYLAMQKGMAPAAIERLLYHECGLKGLSGISNDVRDLLASEAPGARLALDYFAYSIARQTGALAAVLGGLDGFVFTAGVGENSAWVREQVCRRLAWLGLELDSVANQGHGPLISAAGSRLAAYVIPTDEERMIAIHTLQVLRGG
jgi:acetate kinase